MIVKNKKSIRFIAFAFSLAIMVFVFIMSAQNATESSATSGSFIRFLAPLLNGKFDIMSEAEQIAYISSLQHFVRKAAHFSVYTALGFFLSIGTFTFSIEKIYLRAAIGFAVGAMYAVCDEIHQSFIPGRSGELRDVLIDSSGVLLGVLLITVIYFLYKKIKACR